MELISNCWRRAHLRWMIPNPSMYMVLKSNRREKVVHKHAQAAGDGYLKAAVCGLFSALMLGYATLEQAAAGCVSICIKQTEAQSQSYLNQSRKPEERGTYGTIPLAVYASPPEKCSN